ncbi:serine/threonine protein kinase, CMGC group [Coelomomyces lativittatus]|nr:serine/threonine protein kinase, CMGC group [Coelomomyces lativittatus]
MTKLRSHLETKNHLAQIIELLGPFPKHLIFKGKYAHEYFNRRGELRNITKLRYWNLTSVIRKKYLFSQQDAELISSFISPMIHLNPDKRSTPLEALGHPWLDGYRDEEREYTFYKDRSMDEKSS